jgi:hypothetical protein
MMRNARREFELHLIQIDRLPLPKRHWDRDAYLFYLVQTKSNRKMGSRRKKVGRG